MIFPCTPRTLFDLPPRIITIVRLGFWATLMVGVAAAVALVISSYQCGSEFVYAGCSYIPIFWFIQAILIGLAVLFLGILYYARTEK